MFLTKNTADSAINAAIGGIVDFFSCELLPESVLADIGHKRVFATESSTGDKGNVISSGSVVTIANGQCALIVEQNKVIDLCTEPGEYIFKTDSPPNRKLRIYYCITKEITGNRYGTPSDVPYRLRDDSIAIDFDVRIRLYGAFSYQIENPVLFFTNVCGDITEPFTRDKIERQLKSELIEALFPAFEITSAMGIGYSDLPEHSAVLTDALNNALVCQWRDLRGLALVEVSVAHVMANSEDEGLITSSLTKSVLRPINNNDPAGLDSPPQIMDWACPCGYTGNSGEFCVKRGNPNYNDKPNLYESRQGAYCLSNDMRYAYLSVGNKDTRTAISIVNSTLSPDQKAHPRFRVGNIAFIEIITSTPNLTDSFSSSKYVGVILGDEPRLVPMPSKELFTHYAKIVRANPGIMEPNQRIRAALILATGNESYKVDESTWTDEDGSLIIKYNALVRLNMAKSITTSNTLTVDANQNFTIDSNANYGT